MKLLIWLALTTTSSGAATYVGNASCRPCHTRIYESYSATPMARSSGRVIATFPGRFRHAASSVEYRIDARGAVRFGDSEKQLDWFIGSGAAGRSFLYSQDGFVYQAPITFYSQKGAWDVSPGYENDKSTRWNRPIESSCFFCHASQARPIFGTQNRFSSPPFAQDGVGCERCHGPGSDHVAGNGRMVNPAKLDPPQRDAVCAQCHLSGEARINKPGRSIAMFRPGERLSDFVSYFVFENANVTGVKATGYVEKLYSSRCKMASGDRLWCGTCHDPHRPRYPSGVVAYYREKCLTCHQGEECQRGPDCRGCHMPRARAVDGGHGVLTDHSLPRKLSALRFDRPQSWRLVPFKDFDADARSLGLAYAEVSLRTQDKNQQNQAVLLLGRGRRDDGEALARLADLCSRQGDRTRAYQLYNNAFRADPNSVVVLVNLGGLEAERGNAALAIELWQSALERNPGLVEAATNIETLLNVLGRRKEAEAHLNRARRIERGLAPR